MEIIYILLVILAISRLFGEAAVRIGQPAIVGELLSGILIGIVAHQYADQLPLLSTLTDNEAFIALTELGVFFLMLHAGLDLRPKDIAEASGYSLFVALSAMLTPLACGFGIAWLFLPDSSYRLAQSLCVGVALAITAVPVAVKVLMDLNLLNSRIGKMVVSSAVFDDIISLVLLAMLTSLIRTGELPNAAGLLLLVGKVAGFFLITFVVGKYVLPTLGKLMRQKRSNELELSFLLIVALAAALLAEAMGMHFIMGAFVTGLFFVRRTIDEETYTHVEQKVSGLTNGFLGPIFFASIGLHLDTAAIAIVPGFVFILILVAFLTKLVGAAIPAFLSGLTWRQSAMVGVAMSGRGAVELIVADVAAKAGLFEQPSPTPPIVENLFSVIVIVAIVTTLAVPILLPPISRKEQQ